MQNRICFYRDMYEKEWTRRSEIRQATALPLAVLTLLGSAIFFYSTNAQLELEFWPAVIVALLLLATASFIVAVFFKIRATFGYEYRRLSYPSEIQEYETALTEWHETHKQLALLEGDIEDFLIDAYVDAGNRNVTNNINSGEFLHKAQLATIITLVFVGLATAPLVAQIRGTPAQPQLIQIVDPGEAPNDGQERREGNNSGEAETPEEPERANGG